MGGVVGQVGKIAGVIGSMKLDNSMASAVKSILGNGNQRDAFNSILLASVAHASSQPQFNLEKEINDLMLRLSQLRSASAAQAATGNISQEVQNSTQDMQGVMQGVSQTLRSINSSEGPHHKTSATHRTAKR